MEFQQAWMLGYLYWMGGGGSEAGALAVRIYVWAKLLGSMEGWSGDLKAIGTSMSMGMQSRGSTAIISVPKTYSSRCGYTSSFGLLLDSVSTVSSRAVCPLEQPSYMGLRQRTAMRCCSRGACAGAMPVWKRMLESTCRWSCFRDKKCDFCLFNYLFFLPGFLPMEQPGGREPKTTIRGPMGSSSQPPSSWRKMSCYTS